MWRKYHQTNMFKVILFKVSTRGIREEQDKVRHSNPRSMQDVYQMNLQSSSQILKHLFDFSLSNFVLGLQSFQYSKIRSVQHWGRRAAHLSENKGVNSECTKFGENSRQIAPVSTICGEYCSLVV